ncbi:MAG: type VI secretion system baseplate subunit TssK [Nitrospira sp.]|jgi:type VI secretion system protein ImpJ|nr:type VI secretion system baseplate subunit TssK [Nitrospira sp.]MDH4243227.1 type VI secretion system baseplate subunit TssK [Nitrospira sp.]MDH4356024.1 type VI secretion system baseplate subunit TssK [Nitrospira sp.]MDH5317427.1 type VI secretion system baseplate subunit TssK [Nitrospira sp.]
MTMNRRVVWSEGLLLTPQHFQQWDRHTEGLITDRFRIHDPFAWGVTSLDIDHDGLANGRLTLLKCCVVLPDGLVIEIPDEDGAPSTRVFTELFQPAMESLSVFLGIPVERSDSMACQLGKESGSRLPRFLAEHIEVIDTTTGDNPREVLVAKKNLRIFFSGEETADTAAIKIGEVVRLPSGTVGLRETYIPPCVWVSASPYLLRLLRGLIELLVAKRATFSDAQRGVLELIGTDLGKFTLVTAVSTHLPVLQHLSQIERVHPETLYTALVRLAGHLQILLPPGESPDLPAYQHENLGRTFDALDKRIRSIVEGVTPTRYISIPLESSGDNVWVGRVPESRLFASAQFFVMASGDMSEDQVRHLVPNQVRVGSPSKLKEIVAAAMPGVKLFHTPRPPIALPMKNGTQYFRMDDRGVFWEEIKKSQVVALHIPESVQSIRVQLVAVKE